MGLLKSQKVLLTGQSEFIPIDQDYEYFIYEGFVYNIEDFEEYEQYNIDVGSVLPIGTEKEWEEMESDERDYFNMCNLYGIGEPINLDWPENFATLVTNAKGF